MKTSWDGMFITIELLCIVLVLVIIAARLGQIAVAFEVLAAKLSVL
jgi:hypothetical protein